MRTTMIVAAMCALGAAAALPTRNTLAQGAAGHAGIQKTSLDRIGDVPMVMPKVHTGTVQAKKTGAPTRYDLPLLGNDLGDMERYYVGKKIHSASGSQMWGYDIGMMKYDADKDTWSEVKPGTDWKKIKNSDYYIYGKPVYAMGDGTIIRCWRNAPQNPRPFSSALGDDFNEAFKDQDWLSQEWRNKMMSGAGNHLLVQEDDGDLILYAHAQTGSIPTSLCPHNATLYSKADVNSSDSEADVPAAQQVRIHAGQKLYLAGNSGNSSAPHLHVHKQKPDNTPVQMQFNRGLSKAIPDYVHADINNWTSFSGQRIPDGPVLFWPPHRLAGEYSRHGYAAKDYQRLFDHLANSGFRPEWIDGYSVGGKPYLNFTWRPATAAWRSYHLLTSADYQARFDEAKQDGYAPTQVESSLVNGQPRYSAIFVKGLPGAYLARHGLTTAQHDALIQEAKGKNLSPVNVSVVSVGGERRYTDLYRSDSIGQWEMKSQVPEASYQALYDANAAAGRRPVYLNGYMHGGQPFYSVIFSQQPAGARKDRHGMTAAQYQTEFDSAMAAGLPTREVSGIDGASSNHRFLAYWRK